MKSIYRLKNAYFRYTDLWVIEDISLDVREGEIFGIIGPNGSGKSSLLKLLSGLNIPQKGEIFLKDIDIARLDQGDFARTVAVVPQESSFLFPFTVGEIVLMGRAPHLKGRFFENSHDMNVAREAMMWMDIINLEERPITDISGGERQRAIIARALTQEPEMLILDEPTASLDIGHQIEIYNLLTRFNAGKGLTIILSSHDLNLASQYCHRLMLMNKGRIYAVGTPFEVITEENIIDVYGCNVIVDAHPVSGTPRVTLLPASCHPGLSNLSISQIPLNPPLPKGEIGGLKGGKRGLPLPRSQAPAWERVAKQELNNEGGKGGIFEIDSRRYHV